MKPTPRILKAVDPDDLIAQVQASLEMGDDLIQSPFISHEGLICQRVTQSLVIYEYMLIVAVDLDSLQKQEQVLDDLSYMFEHSDWFKPYVAGYYAFKNNLPHDRQYVLAHLDQLLDFGRPFPLFEKPERSIA